MKLRNKKTGEIKDVESLGHADSLRRDFGYQVTLSWNKMDNLDECRTYKTLAELNEEWEDYTPSEPLIKDEKIRKAVRAWAEATKIKSVWYDCYHHTLRNRHTQADKHIGCGEALGLYEDRLYTISELCGEEEE